jgi:predicted MPP superfamily phosphohydrolase
MKKICRLLLTLPFIASCAINEYEVEDYRLTMDFHDDFKILQLTDLHFGIESNLKVQFKFVKESIDEANPDLIILTGDNFMYGTKGIVKEFLKTVNPDENNDQ